MDMQGALRARLLAAAPVTALVSTRVYWVTRPQTSALPAIVLQTMGDARPQHMKGFDDLRPARVQVETWALSYAAARAVKEAAVAALAPENTSNGIIFSRGMIQDWSDQLERTETAEIHRHIFDLLFHWQTA